MGSGWRLGPHWYEPEAPLPVPPAAGPSCSWAVVRRDGQGPRCLLQVWRPCPPEPVLDVLREGFLARFSRAEALDSGACHLGFDAQQAWFLQELGGEALRPLWRRADRAGRAELRATLLAALDGSPVPRLLLPEVIGFEAGRPRVPRVLGPAPWDRAALLARLGPVGTGTGSGERPWAAPPSFPDGPGLPLRGRMRELTYLKSLVLGLGAAIPAERVLILRGEAGLGHGRLCHWAAAVAETEGLWVTHLDLAPGEGPGRVVERVLAGLLAGLEPDLYAALPEVARALGGRVPGFAFLAGGQCARSGQPLAPAELQAALAAIAFAQSRHPRLVLLRGLERAAAEVPGLLRDLVRATRIPWVLSARETGPNPRLDNCLSALMPGRDVATVVLDRMGPGPLLETLADLLGTDPHESLGGFLAEAGAASLGNPGLLRSILERARTQGRIQWRDGRWMPAPDRPPVPELEPERLVAVLERRLRRLGGATLGAARCLALADRPLDSATLGRALGLDRDALEEALQAAAKSGLVLAAADPARIAGPAARDLVLARMEEPERLQTARALLGALGGRFPAVRLLGFTLGREAALVWTLEALEALEHQAVGTGLPAPPEAERILQEALALDPAPGQEAALWEFLAAVWTRWAELDGPAGPGALAPRESALAAIDQGQRALGAQGDQGAKDTLAGQGAEERAARLHRKQSLLELRQGRLEPARVALGAASALLADHPFHPEQPRLRLAAGRLHLGLGEQGLALAALEEGLDLVRRNPVAGRRDQLDLMLELGRARGEAAQFQGALTLLEELGRLADQGGDRPMLARALTAQGRVRLALGEADPAIQRLRSAVALAGPLDEPALLAECQLHLGIGLSWGQRPGSAQDLLASASEAFDRLGDSRAAQARAWQARNLAALGDHGLAELLLLRVAESEGPPGPAERGERAFLDGENAEFRLAWGEARRHYQAAGNRFAHAGLVWRELLARLRCIQAEAGEIGQEGLRRPTSLALAWVRLEQLQAPVAAAGSPWLGLEWLHAQAALLAGPGGAATDPGPAAAAWGEVLAGARALGFPALALEAGARCSELLLGLGESQGARARIEEALPSAQAWWAQLPPGASGDLHGFRQAAEQAGIHLPWPERAAGLPT